MLVFEGLELETFLLSGLALDLDLFFYLLVPTDQMLQGLFDQRGRGLHHFLQSLQDAEYSLGLVLKREHQQSVGDVIDLAFEVALLAGLSDPTQTILDHIQYPAQGFLACHLLTEAFHDFEVRLHPDDSVCDLGSEVFLE